jgi:hypothetical protein
MNRLTLTSVGLIAASVLLAVAGIAILTYAGQDPAASPLPQRHLPQPGASSEVARPAASTSPGAGTTAASGEPSAPTTTATVPTVVAAGDGPGGDRAIQQVLDDSSRPNLPQSQAQQMVELGKRIWLAQITGAGRGQWPGYFRGADARFVYHAVRIQAAIARATGSGQVTVNLVWAGTDPTGQVLEDQPATVTLHQNGNTWQPVR